MLLTRSRGLGWKRSLCAGLVVSASGLVTGCGNGASIGSLPAAGGQSGLGGGGAGGGGAGGGGARRAAEGQSSPAAGAGQPAARGGDTGQAAQGSSRGIETDVPAAGGTDEGSGGAAGHGTATEAKRYSGSGFVVHEWGTDTVVVGSDGSLQRGLHHEEEDLPAFVYDRIKAGTLIGSNPSPSVTIKMETPVTYFYSPTPLLVNARVGFPKGVLTQWYPGVTSFLPPVAAAGSVTYSKLPEVLMDPVLDPSFPFVGEMCPARYGALSGGLLDWGDFSVQARAAAPEKPLPSAPLEQFGWSYARAVDANLLQMPSGESERFLFYRGLGEFDLPVTVRAESAGKITFQNGYSEPVGQVFLLNVDRERGAFVVHSAGIAPGKTLVDTVPSLQGAPALDDYVVQLSDAVSNALDTTGLYHDEAIAMVNTWRKQWFRTPGVRALYLLPQSWTEQSIPLTISPKPDATVRVMLIRVELISQEQEAADVSAVSAFDSDASLAVAYFSALGRFAEPRLRRALQLSPNAAGAQYLSQIAGPQSRVSSGE